MDKMQDIKVEMVSANRLSIDDIGKWPIKS